MKSSFNDHHHGKEGVLGMLQNVWNVIREEAEPDLARIVRRLWNWMLLQRYLRTVVQMEELRNLQ
eukprot:5702496-Amphidinium_carterae.1